LQRWPEIVDWAAGASLGDAVPFAEEDLWAPSPEPRQVFAVGLNYLSHAKEGGVEAPPSPSVFTKFPACLTGPYADVTLPEGSVDWEAELVVVIGRRCERVAAADAWAHVAGLCVGQDISERELQLAGALPQFSLGKSFPGFGPVGPWLVTPDEFDDPGDLAVECHLNGELVQKARTSEMIYPVPVVIERISAVCPLLPGDVIFTGTPEGVGFGRKPPLYMNPGDELITTIEGIGTLRNRMVKGETTA
jgi:2,4-didehydro-3-deoxy-L-rhamnonate hydrolase